VPPIAAVIIMEGSSFDPAIEKLRATFRGNDLRDGRMCELFEILRAVVQFEDINLSYLEFQATIRKLERESGIVDEVGKLSDRELQRVFEDFIDCNKKGTARFGGFLRAIWVSICCI
jgi:hypothetical protein